MYDIFKLKPSLRKSFICILSTLFLVHVFLSHPSLQSFGSQLNSNKDYLSLSKEGLIRPYYFPPYIPEPSHLEKINSGHLIKGLDFIDINTIHEKGIVHEGSVVFVLDSNGNVSIYSCCNVI
mmetsp:Transcript_15666/g.22303  ORF Transcript_15666/g.22303 Transcript_15666/m.22303 type:complete len:122 (-) Transcript_15666:24-389(-)